MIKLILDILAHLIVIAFVVVVCGIFYFIFTTWTKEVTLILGVFVGLMLIGWAFERVG